jgi:hypothetical protein
MNRLIYGPHDHTYTDLETGETIPAERLDEYVQGKLEAAIKELAESWVAARVGLGGTASVVA